MIGEVTEFLARSPRSVELSCLALLGALLPLAAAALAWRRRRRIVARAEEVAAVARAGQRDRARVEARRTPAHLAPLLAALSHEEGPFPAPSSHAGLVEFTLVAGIVAWAVMATLTSTTAATALLGACAALSASAVGVLGLRLAAGQRAACHRRVRAIALSFVLEDVRERRPSFIPTEAWQ